jgi:non-specific serine/threonine protein kinase
MSGAIAEGAELAGYRVTGLLGRGGMGFVYEAEHQLLKRKAAVKTLAPELGGGADFRERFIRESQTVAAIDHPNIIPIYDAGEIDSLVYIAMRYVKGPDLEKLIAEGGTRDPHEALSILEQVAGALDAAHAHEIIHRDIKPPNVMVEDGSGRIYLMDFGIAKQGGARGLTQAGVFVGTVDYAAPEQIQAQEVSASADLYAFGGVLYQSLTGKKPYERDTDVAVMFAHIMEPPPKISEARPELPAALDEVIAKAMAKTPEERFGTARELVEAARAALGGAVVAGHAPAAAAAAAAVPTPPPPRPNLPTPATPLVGRSEELAAVTELLGQGNARVVSLTGLGGSGKTRLALEAAITLQESFEQVFFVDLQPVRDPQLVGSAIADVLGVQETPNQPLQAALAERLAETSTLLLLDNFGQVLPAAPFVADLVGAAPALRVLVTSRTPLRVRGEREYSVPPLAVPANGAGAANNPAVELFVERAQEAKPSFELTSENLPAVSEICRRLEGIPLAIELAAARIKLLTPEQILGRLEEKRLSFLTGGTETIRDAIEWSYNLLDERGKSLFARLAVFTGGSSLEAAEAVAGQPLGLEFGDVLDGIASLVDNGLVRQGEAVDGEPRFSMLETIREYALERLTDADDLDDTRNRHLNRYVQLAETAEPELTRSGQAVWLERLSEENDNIRAALAWSFASGQVELGLRLAGALVRFWSVRGLMTEGRRWLTEALAESTGVEPGVLGKAYFAAGYAALGQGDFPQAKPFFEESLRLAEQAGDKRLQAQAYQQIGWLVSAGGKHEADEAKHYAEQALELARQIGDKLVQSGALNILAEVAAGEGDETAANALYEQSLALRRELGDKRLIANSVLTLGRAELTRGDNQRATSLLLEGCTLARELGDTWSVSVALINLARVALRNGDLPEAGKLFSEALMLAKERGDKRAAAECLQGLAAYAAADGGTVQGARLLAAAAALLEAIGATPSAIEVAINEQATASLTAALGEEQLAGETAAGRALPTEDAVELALQLAPAPGDLMAATA